MEKKCKTCNGEIEVDGFSECWKCIGWTKEPIQKEVMTETEFLRYILNEINTIHYGEGVSFNLTFLAKDVRNRMADLKVTEQQSRVEEEEISKLRRKLKETEVLFANQVRTNSELYQDNQELKKRIKELEK